MFDQEVDISYVKINDIINGSYLLEDKFEIEGVLSAMRNIENKIAFLKELKKRRAAAIDVQIESQSETLDKLKEAVKGCMQKNKEKTLDFPGVGKVQVRETKGTWSILDKDALRKDLEKIDKFASVSEESWDFNKKDLNKLLDELRKNNNVPASVKQEDSRISLSVSYPETSFVIADNDKQNAVQQSTPSAARASIIDI
jgi:hypothetical protein